MDSPEYERKRMERVNELEQMVKKLEKENKQLLTRVKSSASQSAVGTGTQGRQEGELTRLDSLEDGIIDLDGVCENEGPEDEWLYKSPVCVATPTQKELTPLKWLSEGHSSVQSQKLPSLDEVRKTLLFTIDDAESLSRDRGASPPLVAKNKTAQKYLEQVRARRQSPPSINPLDLPHEDRPGAHDDVPVVNWKARMPASSTNVEEIPKVNWSPRSARRQPVVDAAGISPPKSEEEVEPETIPKISWKKPVQVPDDDSIPKVRWKPRPVADDDNEMLHSPEEEVEPQTIPKISWKKPVQVPDDDSIPKVRWKPRPVADDDNEMLHSPETQDEVPKVRWRPRQVVHSKDTPGVVDSEELTVTSVEDHELVPKVNWKSRARAGFDSQREVTEEQEVVPKISWKKPTLADSDKQADGEENIQKIKWKRPAAVDSHSESQQEEKVPKIKWKKPATTDAHNEVEDEVPKIKWKKSATAVSHNETEDDVSIAQSKSQSPLASASYLGSSPKAIRKPRNIPVKAIVTQRGRRPDEDQLSQESYGSGSDAERGEVGNHRDVDLSLEDDSVERVPRHRSYPTGFQRSTGGLRTPHSRSSGHIPHPAGSSPVNQTLGSRSPSPLLRTTPQTAVRSRSPSPSLTSLNHQTTSITPQSISRSASSLPNPRTLSPNTRSTPVKKATSLGSSQGKRKVITPNNRKSESTSPASAAQGRHPSGLPHHPSAPGSLSTRDPSPRGRLGPSALTPPGGNQRPSQRTQGGKGTQTTPLSRDGKSPSSGRIGRQPSQAQSRRAVAQPSAEDNSWLEGCF